MFPFCCLWVWVWVWGGPRKGYARVGGINCTTLQTHDTRDLSSISEENPAGLQLFHQLCPMVISLCKELQVPSRVDAKRRHQPDRSRRASQLKGSERVV